MPQSSLLSELTFNGDLKELERLSTAIGEFCRARKLGEDLEFRLNLVLEELFTNSVRHGGCAGAANAAKVRLDAAEDHVDVEYADRGVAFDPADAPAPDLESPLETRPAGGLGLHFVRQIAPDFEYDRSDEWNRIRLRLPL